MKIATTEQEAADALLKLQETHVYCGFCGVAMEPIKTEAKRYDRLTGQLYTARTRWFWQCKDGLGDDHDRVTVGAIDRA